VQYRHIDDGTDIGNNVDMICALSAGCIANGVRAPEGVSSQVVGASACPFPSSVRFSYAPRDGEAQTGAGLMLFYLLASSVLCQGHTPPVAMVRYSEIA
jgi:hypothetical protein